MEDFDGVYQRYIPQVYRYLCALCRDSGLAKELAQETFVQALEHIERFRGECSLYAWLCQIGKNQYRNWLRRNRRREKMEGGLEQETGGEVEEALLDRETAMELHRRLHRLPEPYREVLQLRIFGELSYKQIGELFEKTENWACVTGCRARKMLRERWEAEEA